MKGNFCISCNGRKVRKCEVCRGRMQAFISVLQVSLFAMDTTIAEMLTSTCNYRTKLWSFEITRQPGIE